MSWTIAHATDLLPDGGIAFEHAVALARDGGAKLITLYANPQSGETTRSIPAAPELLARWHQEDCEVAHDRRTHDCCDDPVDTLLDAMREIVPDLLVIGTHRRTGVSRLLQSSVSTSVALNASVPTLLLPIGEHGFVDSDSGAVHLDRIVVPVGSEEDAGRSLEVVVGMLEELELSDVEVHLLCVGDATILDSYNPPATERATFIKVHREGRLEPTINHYADEVRADLIAMATRQQDSVLDFFVGTHTEKVVHRAARAVMSVPIA